MVFLTPSAPKNYLGSYVPGPTLCGLPLLSANDYILFADPILYSGDFLLTLSIVSMVL